MKLSPDRLFLKAINILYHHGILPEHRLMIVAALNAKIAQLNPFRNYVQEKIMQSFLLLNNITHEILVFFLRTNVSIMQD